MTKQTYIKKHQLWLNVLFASFAIDDQKIKSDLFDFSQIMFRHMKWLGEHLLEQGDDYNYDRDGMMLYKRKDLFEILNALIEEIDTIQSFYDNSQLAHRIQSDDTYIKEYITQLLAQPTRNQPITAFSMERKWEDLDQEQIDALTLFLFDESYKEYELILIYAYMQARTTNLQHYNVFQDLVDESYFHLKSFGNMMAKLGILALPRELHEMTYIVKDLQQFVKDGIDEEIAAKEMCKELSDAIKDEKLSKFFDFINEQESYHIELMQKLL